MGRDPHRDLTGKRNRAGGVPLRVEMIAALITLAFGAAVAAAFALDLRDARGEAGGLPSTIATAALVACVLAALAPIGALLPGPSLSHVSEVPSFDVIRPCVAPLEGRGRTHAIAPFAVLRVVFPIIIAAALSARARALVRPRRVLAIAMSFAAIVFVLSSVRAIRGGVEPSAIRACGALTPEEGADGLRVRAVIDRLVVDGRQQLIRWRQLPRLPRPPWVRSEIPVTIANEPWVLRLRGDGVVAEPDDLRRADRPLPVLHFASIPTLASGEGGAKVLIDRRPDGNLYAVRVGRPVHPSEIGSLLRAPRWPALLVAATIALVFASLWLSRVRRDDDLARPPYRTAPDEGHGARPRFRAAIPALAALALIEVSATALHAIWPYL